jgi:hypothetical protein
MLATANANGHVDGSVPGFASLCRISVPEMEASLAKLSGPDPHSRTPDFEGRRIEAVRGGWQILNYQHYRGLRDPDERRRQTREAVQRFLERAKAGVSHGKPGQAEAEAEADNGRSLSQGPTDLSTDNNGNNAPMGPRAREEPEPRPYGSAPPKNELLDDPKRASMRSELNALIRELADRQDVDPTEVLALHSEFKGQSYVNPASMGDDRLIHTLRSMRSAKKRLDDEAKRSKRETTSERITATERDAALRKAKDKDWQRSLGAGLSKKGGG